VQKELQHAADLDRVRAATSNAVNARIDNQSEYRLGTYSDRPDSEIGDRLSNLNIEWDLERVLELEASITGLAGLVLGLTVSKRFLLVPGFASAMVLLHAVQGWYPLLPAFRRLGLRTQNEIDRERFGLKALRGDFTPIVSAEAADRAKAAWRAVLA
jgi:hypothetical protein